MAGPSLDDEESSPEPPDKSPSPHALAERAELRRQIEAGLAALPPEYRQVLILRKSISVRMTKSPKFAP